MSIYTFLKDDHKKMKKIMNQIDKMGPEADESKNESFNDLKKLLISHSKAEEKAFYTPLKKYDVNEAEVEHGAQEHEEVKELLVELTNRSLAGSAWQQKFKRLKNLVEHHIDEEESKIFSDAKSVLNEKDENLMEANMHIMENKEQRIQNVEERHLNQ